MRQAIRNGRSGCRFGRDFANQSSLRDVTHRNSASECIKDAARDFLNRSGKHDPAPRYPNGEGPFYWEIAHEMPPNIRITLK